MQTQCTGPVRSSHRSILTCADSTHTVTVKRTPDDIFNGVPLDSVIPLLSAVVAAPVQILLIFRAASVSNASMFRRGSS